MKIMKAVSIAKMLHKTGKSEKWNKKMREEKSIQQWSLAKWWDVCACARENIREHNLTTQKLFQFNSMKNIN